MKLQTYKNKLETNTQSDETQEFSIGDIGKVIEILRSKMYEMPIQTLCQEYMSNAKDSHSESGNTDPIEVTIPTALNPVFKVKDFGVGITPDRMADAFIRYGSSTKRADNKQKGGFGLGCKIGFSYSDSFSVVSTTGGFKRTYIAHLGANSNGRLDLVSTEATDEPNGAEIQVAVKPGDIEEFRNAVFRATYFWDQRPVYKGVLDVPPLVKGYRLGQNLEVISGDDMLDSLRLSHYSNDMLAVIDGIPYPIPSKLIEKVPALQTLSKLVSEKVILHFGNGVVEVAASRESIADSPSTIEGLKQLANKAILEVRSLLTSRFGAVKDSQEYLATYAELSQYFQVDRFAKFGSYSINNGLLTSSLFKNVGFQAVTNVNRRRQKCDKLFKTNLDDPRKAIDVKKFDSVFFVNDQESIAVQNKRIREYFKTHTHMIVLSVSGNSKSDFDQVIKDLGAKDFKSIIYVDPPKLPREQRAKVQRENAEFCYHGIGGSGNYTTLAGNTDKWLYVEIKDGEWVGFDRSQLNSLSSYLGTHRICGLASRAIKMVQGDPNYKPLKEWLDAWKPDCSAINKAKHDCATNKRYIDTLEKLGAVKDKFLVEMVKEYSKLDHNSLPEILLAKTLETKEVQDFKLKDAKLGESISKHYPLFDHINDYNMPVSEMVWYVNAKFDEQN